MFKYFILFALISPLIGILMVENGEFGLSIGQTGYPNGAWKIYCVYMILAFLTSLVIVKIKRRGHLNTTQTYRALPNSEDKDFFAFTNRLIVLNLFLLIILLFGFGGFKVWMGSMDKGQFRTSFGAFGSVIYMLTKFAVPGLFAYSTCLYIKSSKSFIIRGWWLASILLILLLGSAWGFKSAGISMLLPGLLIFYWRVSVGVILRLSIFFIIVMWVLFKIFDSGSAATGSEGISFIITRLTVMHGDASWFAWESYLNGVVFPDYSPTLFAAFGDILLKVGGVDRSNLYEWMTYHYDWMLQYISGIPLEKVDEGHNIVGTAFTEGLVAGGVMGIIFFGILAGIIIGVTYRMLRTCLYRNNWSLAAILAAYFCFNVFPWLIGGSITQLFHISNAFGFLFTLAFIELFRQKLQITVSHHPKEFS